MITFKQFLVESFKKPKAKVTPEIGAWYKLSPDASLVGDYAGETVEVETGPRNKGTSGEQYRISMGPGRYDVDWIDTWMFNDSTKLDKVSEDTKGDHGEYKNDASEKTMIHKIMDLCIQGDGSTCPRIEKNYKIAYDFIESKQGGDLWNRYYELFHEKDPKFIGPQNKAKFTRFKNEARDLFKKWQKSKLKK